MGNKTLWIARDKSKALWIYCDKPIRFENSFDTETGIEPKMWLNDEDFPEVTWENSPQQVELKLKER